MSLLVGDGNSEDKLHHSVEWLWPRISSFKLNVTQFVRPCTGCKRLCVEMNTEPELTRQDDDHWFRANRLETALTRQSRDDWVLQREKC
ncbi:hypothetical protein AVEN_119301-1 [Araneus ventricosus]|uniref:Uncharacterized protein n=1 Tax=Araneus ventricosus TaxID=182803 RepID=A0A4Y2XAW0_ARAVE|nr:hypothetical protein AVEN_119301-1 [Araneus ventricosus]